MALVHFTGREQAHRSHSWQIKSDKAAILWAAFPPEEKNAENPATHAGVRRTNTTQHNTAKHRSRRQDCHPTVSLSIYSIYLSIHLSNYLSVYLSIYVSVLIGLSVFIRQYVCLSARLPVCLSVCPSLCPLTCASLPICLSLCPCPHLAAWLSICLIVRLPVFLSVCRPAWRAICLHVDLSFCPFACMSSICLSVFLSACSLICLSL